MTIASALKVTTLIASTVFFAGTAVAQLQMNAGPDSQPEQKSLQAPTPAPGTGEPNNREIQAQPETLPIRIISKDMFCKRLQLTFVQYAANSGYNKVQTAMLASTASQMVIQEFRSGRATDYMNAAALAHYAHQPANFIGTAMGLSANVALALSTGELRFIPYAQKDTDIVVIAQNAAPLTTARAQKIVEVARSLKVRVSVLWVGAESIDEADLERTRLLGWIVGMTGGFLTNLGGSETPCGTLM
jgi:hypothetical protein